MPSRGSAWWRAAVVALVVTAVLSLLPVIAGADDPGAAIGMFLGRGLLAYLITAAWAFFSRRHWGWGRYVLTFVAISVLLGVVSGVGTPN